MNACALVCIGASNSRSFNWLRSAAAAEALALLQERPDAFDVVVTDLTMPGMTGLELAGKVRALRQGLPLILCTGFSHLVNGDIAKAAGIRAVLLKPLTKRELAMTLRRVLDRQAGA